MRLGFLLLLASCAGAGPYGHSPKYVPLGEEEKITKGATEYDPVMYGRLQEEWRKKTVSAFGVVTARGTGQGAAYVTMSVRRLEPRNLCDNANDEDSCRVTVSDAEFGVLHLLVALQGEDDVGEHSVGAGSLLRVVGKLGEDADPTDAAPVMRVQWYRHWPRASFVTKSAASIMRQ